MFEVASSQATVDRFPPPPADALSRRHDGLRLIVTVRISELAFGDSPRLDGENREHVRLLAEAGAVLPPILVHRKSMRVIDGVHRVRAAHARGEETIRAQYFDGAESEAFVLAVESNIAHGLPLTTADRKAAAGRIMATHAHWSDRAIALCTGLSDRTVSTLRPHEAADPAGPDVRVGQDGRSRPLSIAQGRIRASEIMAAHPTIALRSVAASAGISLGTAHDVRKRMQRGADPVPAGQRGAGRPDCPAAHCGPDRPDRPAGPDPGRGLQTALGTLRSDPSVRFNDAGRAALRWLCTHAVEAQDWGSLLDGVPSHCTEIVAVMARRSAESWLELARELDRRAGAQG